MGLRFFNLLIYRLVDLLGRCGRIPAHPSHSRTRHSSRIPAAATLLFSLFVFHFSLSILAFAPLTREEAALGREVCVTGVVTCVAHWQKNSCIIADVTAPDGMAIYVAGEHPNSRHTPLSGTPLAKGDVLEVRGVTVPMFFAPGISARQYTRLGHMELRPAPMRNPGDFAFGTLDNRRTRMTGVITHLKSSSGGYVSLTLTTPYGAVDTRVHTTLATLKPLLDAEVEVEGVAMSRYNHRAEFLGLRLEIDSASDISVTRPPPDDPFSVRRIPLNAILAWTPGGHDTHRIRVRGTVTATRDGGVFYLQEGEAAIRATAIDDSVPQIGQTIEVAGFAEMIGEVGQLTGVIWRELQEHSTIPPLCLGIDNVTNLSFGADIVFDDFDCRLVKLRGRAYRVEKRANAFEMSLDVGGVGVTAWIQGSPPDWIADELPYAPLVEATGIARISTSDEKYGRRPGLSSLSVEVQCPDDIKFMPDAKWRSSKLFARLLYATAALIIAAVIASVWFFWRMRVRKGRQRLLSLERRRMAADLHDTIEQHLAGARILLSTAEANIPLEASACTRALSMAQNVLAEAKNQIREVILDLRDDNNLSRPLAAQLADFARELNSRAIVKARMRLRGIPDALRTDIKSNIVAIARQAVTNAISHGDAKNIVFVSDPGTDGAWTLRILNDGAPFDPSNAPGPESGHFGLSNMRQRAKQCGLAISWEHDAAWSCVRLSFGGKK